ncbi:MAG: hypothetical protein R3B81_16045 [bacterium]
MTDTTRNPDIILVWPPGKVAPAVEPVAGYSVRDLPTALDSWWIDIHRLAVPSFRRNIGFTWNRSRDSVTLSRTRISRPGEGRREAVRFVSRGE